MSSVDFKVFVQSEVEDCERKADVYVGAQDDLGAPAEHFTTEHLEALLSRDLPRELRSLYLSEYSEIRAGLRAIALSGMSRTDFYDHAAQMSISDRSMLSDTLGRHAYVASLSERGYTDSQLAEIKAMEEDYTSRKSQIQDRATSEGGVSIGDRLTDKDIVRNAMVDVDGANSRGVSVGRRRVQ